MEAQPRLGVPHPSAAGGRGADRQCESEGGKKLFSLTESGRAAADEGPDAPWEEASRGIDLEALGEIRQAGFGLMEAFGQVWKTGSKEQREKALAVINDARKKLYLILADED